MTAPRETTEWFLVPVAARPVACAHCGAPVYWVYARSRRVAVSCEPRWTPTAHEAGRGVNHATVCGKEAA